MCDTLAVDDVKRERRKKWISGQRHKNLEDCELEARDRQREREREIKFQN